MNTNILDGPIFGEHVTFFIVATPVKLDYEYLLRHDFWYDLKIFALTFSKVVKRDGVTH